MARQAYTISHTGTVLEDAGEDSVWRYENQTDPQRLTEILEFRCPTNFDGITYQSQRDPIRFEPRTHELANAPGASYDLETRINPVAGEADIEDQPYPSVIAADVDGNEIEIEEVDHSAGTVYFAEDQAEDVHVYPIVTEGTFQMRLLNTLNQDEGPVYKWEFPIYRWHDMKQDKQGTEVNLAGSARWKEDEKLQIMVDSPDTIVWEHASYPGSYVSTLEMDVTIDF